MAGAGAALTTLKSCSRVFLPNNAATPKNVFEISIWRLRARSGGEIRSLRYSIKFEDFKFGRVRVDGAFYDHDLVIDHGKIRKRKKKPSKMYRESFGHTLVSVEETIPWNCAQLVIATGMGALPVMKEVKREARRRGVELRILPTSKAIQLLNGQPKNTNAILHVTC